MIIFEIEGVPRRKLLKKQRSYIAAHGKSLEVELDGDYDKIKVKNIFNIHIQEPVTDDVDSRTTVVDYYDEGEEIQYELEDKTFEGLSYKMERLLDREWYDLCPWHAAKKNQPATVRWFNACCAISYISSGIDPDLFGGVMPTPECIVAQKKELYEGWGFNNAEDLQDMLPRLYEGRAVKDYQRELSRLETLDAEHRYLVGCINRDCGPNGIWAWDLVRLLLLSALGYVSRYLEYQEALEWSLKAGEKLQSLYGGWDEMVLSYLYGYRYWSGEDWDDAGTEVWRRKRIYEQLKQLPHSPYRLDWQLPLKREWQPA